MSTAIKEAVRIHESCLRVCSRRFGKNSKEFLTALRVYHSFLRQTLRSMNGGEIPAKAVFLPNVRHFTE